MASWNIELPDEAIEGELTHIGDHNALTAAVQEGRDKHDALERAVDSIEIPDLTGYATESYVDAAVAGVPLPSIDGLASEAYVDSAVGAIEIPEAPDLSGYATKDEIPSVDGLASEAYADQAAADAAAAIPDATAGRRGMMPAAAARDLERLATEPLSRRVLRAALEGQRSTGVGIVFAGSSTIQGDKATSTDRRPAQRISGYLTPRPAQTAVSGSTPANGVQVWAWGIGGSTSSNYLNSNHYTAVGTIKPVLMVHMVGSNDWSGSRTPTQYNASMRAHLDALKAASPDTVHLLIGQHQRNSPASGSHPWTDYTDVLRALAEEDPGRVEFLDLWPRYAAIGIPGADPWGWLHSDGIHLTDQSYRVLADWLAEHLGIPTPTGQAETYTATHTGGTVDNGTVIFSMTIPARPYPRTGAVTGVLFARKRGTRSEFKLTAAGKALITRANVPEDTTVDGVSMPLAMQIDVPAGEPFTVTGTASGGQPVYYSDNPEWGNLAAHIAAC